MALKIKKTFLFIPIIFCIYLFFYKAKNTPFNRSDISRNLFMLKGPLEKQGYDWWWHSLTEYDTKTGEPREFFIEYFTCNPQLVEDNPILGQKIENKDKGKKPSYFMLKVGAWGRNQSKYIIFIQ